MRILVVCKRQYTGKDLIDDRYGRLFELPERLQAAGQQVRGIALSYRRRPQVEHRSPAGVEWRSINALPLGALHYAAEVDKAVAGWKPDVIWASSDAMHAMVGRALARRYAIPYVVDLYDNYESFGMTRLPGLRAGLRRACAEAAAVTVVTDALHDKVRAQYRPRGALAMLGNGVDRSIFHPRDRRAMRRKLGLPEQARIIGTAGSITRHRGIDDMFRAFGKLAQHDDRLWLAYAGPRDGTPRSFPHPRMRDLGLLPQHAVPELLSALDVAVICNRDSEFGRYCYPMKLEEAIACGTPVLAARAGGVAERLDYRDDSLYAPGDHEGLAVKLRARLEAAAGASTLRPVSWDELALRLSDVLRSAAEARAN
ncbi:glycosyltransferase [Lysobacter sp.]|uniref:glycosyltransferase n=1 Tax=Lysobacter sp. TaxID=72226 RepID=UPI002D71776C|nr:glycosyltransferase [Lysobacter sp.]HZX77226.1 glycosyltransferase [Lysobacter sp.]